MTEKESSFKTLFNVNVDHHTYTKPISKNLNLKYLQWAWVWWYLKNYDPKTKLSFKQFPEYDWNSHSTTGRNVDFCDTANGCYVTAILTVKGITQEQSLPVMDNRNKAVMHPDMMAINKAKQRAFVKCAALFGLGLKIYGMEDTVSYNQHHSYTGRRTQRKSSPQSKAAAMSKKPVSNKQIHWLKGLTSGIDAAKLNDKQIQAFEWADKSDFSKDNMYVASCAISILKNAPKKSKSKVGSK